MGQYREHLLRLFRRCIIALPFFAAGFYLLLRASGDQLQAAGTSLLGAVGLIAGAIILAFPLARLVAEPFGNLFWSDRSMDRIRPMYSIPQSQRAKGQYEEAIAGFARLAESNPGEVRPYLEMIDVVVVDLRDPVRARQMYEKGMSDLKEPQAQEHLTRMYEAISTRLNGPTIRPHPRHLPQANETRD